MSEHDGLQTGGPARAASQRISVMVVLRRLLQGRRGAMAVAMGAAALASATALAQPLIAGRVVDEASHGGVSLGLAALLVAAFVVSISAEAWDVYLFYRLGEDVVLDQRRAYASHLIALPVADLDHLRLGDLVARATADTTELQELPRKVSRVVIGACTLAVAATLMVQIDGMLAASVLGIVAASFIGGSLLLAKAGRAAAARQQAVGEYGARLERTLGAIRTVKMYGAHADHGATIAEAAADARRAGMRLARLGAISNPVVRITATGSLVIVLVAGATRVSEGVISIGELVTLFLFTLYSLAPLQDVYNGLTSLQTAAAANSRIEDILARPTETLDPEPVTPTHHTPGTEVPSDRLLEASNVGFSYGDQRVLQDVSFRLDRNQVTAVIGPSGAGKSTLLSLICRFYDPHAGQLVFAGQPYRSLALPDLRGRIALVEQDNPVLHGSLRVNLVMGRPDAADDEIWDVLRQVSLDRFIDQLPHGLDTNVLDRGRALSGGQRQRLAIARALLSPAELILLDEPTAHLDRVNEYAMTDTLMQQRKHRSLLVVAHRMSTVEHADHILVLDRGRITDRGTHTDLLAHSTQYRRLVHEQHGVRD